MYLVSGITWFHTLDITARVTRCIGHFLAPARLGEVMSGYANEDGLSLQLQKW